jgi:DNA-binding MarR family transcriptional regulator
MPGLSEDEAAVWHAVKSLGSTVVRRIGVDIAAATGLSGADYGVISRLDDLGDGRLGQQALTESMQLTKGAMSHQLTRMAERGLITREKGASGVTVVLTGNGRDVLARARPVHAAAVREHLTGRLSAEERGVLLGVAGRLGEGAQLPCAETAALTTEIAHGISCRGGRRGARSDHGDEHERHRDAHGNAAAAGYAGAQEM